MPVPTGPVDTDLLPATARIGADGRLRSAGATSLDLAEDHGTPLFVYDEAHLRAACREAVAAWGDGVAYATKAFLCVAMARLAHEEGMCLDVSTGGELHVALTAGVPADRLVLHGNNKSTEELAAALSVGVGRIIVDSFDEIDRLERLVADPPQLEGGPEDAEPIVRWRPRVLARITPGVEVHTHEFVRTGQEDSKFGFGLASGAAARAVARLAALDAAGVVEFVGIHAHLGSQVFALEPFAQAIDVLAGFFAPLGLPELVVGGGLGVAYVNGEQAPPMAEWAESVRAACRRAGIARVGPGHGRARPVHRGRRRAHALPGRDGQGRPGPPDLRVGRRRDERQPPPRPLRQRLRGVPAPGGRRRPPGADPAGGQALRDGRRGGGRGFVPEDLAVGDVLCTPVTGAYGHSMASNYNKVPRPAVVFVADGVARTVVRRETFDDLVRLDV